MIELILLALMGIGYLAGIMLARSHRRKLVRRLTKEQIQKAQYTLSENLDPIEYSILLFGKITKECLDGYSIYLVHRKYATINPYNGELTIHREQIPLDKRSPVINAALKYGSLQAIPRSSLLDTVVRSLHRKGWLDYGTYIKSPNQFLRVFDFKLLTVTISVLFIGVVSVFSYLHIFRNSPDGIHAEIYVVMVLTFVVIFIAVIIMALTIRTAIHQFYVKSKISRSITPKFREQYNEIVGLYTYMSVAGADTMTPRPNDVTLSGVDKLYPYFVAAKLDKTNIRKVGF